MQKVRLNLGSGDCPIEGYTNIDRRNGQEAYPLDYPDGSVDEIRASHILEHFGRKEALEVLKNWVSKLKPGGLLKIAVPDFARITEMYKGGDTNTTGYLCGGQTDEDDYHKNIFDRKSLAVLLEQAGLYDIKHWDSEIKDCASLPVSLNMQGNRPNGSPELDRILKGFSARRKNKYSQYGEDGIIEAIFERLGAKNNWVLEVGASDGMLFSNSRQFVEQGWNAVLVESDKLAYDRLVENCKNYPNARPIFAEVGPDCTLDGILEEAGAPKDIDLMIIDIDGQDYHVFNAMMEYRPRVMVVEFNPEAESEYIPVLGSDAEYLDQAGRTAIIRLGSSKGYRACIDTQVNVIMLHESNFEITKNTDPEEEKQYVQAQVVPQATTQKTKTISRKITAIMSAPRLGFTHNLMIASKVLVPLGIDLEIGFGVFWAQVLSRIIEEQIAKGVEWIVVLDYDSYYLREHFLALCQLMAEYPEADAIMPIQIKRESNTVLAGVNDTSKANVEYDANTDLIEVDTGHFGLTFFRLSSFARLKKPWFLAVPNDKGEWGEGRLDDDIYFWKNFRESGLKLCLTPQVSIGHLQLMISWPGTLEKGSVPFHQYINDCDANGIPEWCKVSNEYIPKQIKQ
jgi:hypothetical protein